MLTLLLFRYYPLELTFYIFFRLFLRILRMLKIQTASITIKFSMENLVRKNPLNKKIREIQIDRLIFFIRGYDYSDFLTVTSPEYAKPAILILHRISKIKPQTFIDVGAHVGTFALRVAKLLSNTKVIAVEPSPLSVWLLRKAAKRNGLDNVKIVAGAAYSVDEMFINLYLSEFSTGNTIYRYHPKRPKVKLINSIKSQTITLDSLAEINEFRKPIFLKIDAEGAEWEILKGAEKLIADVDEIFLEIHFPPREMRKGLCFCDTCNYLREKGFYVLTVSSDKKSHVVYGVRSWEK